MERHAEPERRVRPEPSSTAAVARPLHPERRLLWGLAAAGLAMVCAAAALLVVLLAAARAPWWLMGVLGVTALVVILDLLLTLRSIVAASDLRLWRTGTPQLRLLLALARLGRRIIGSHTEPFLQSFVHNNNLLVRAVLRSKRSNSAAGPRLLLLAPICLQSQGCDRDIASDPFCCERCGKCPVKDLVQLAEERGLELHFVGGGTLARALLEQRAPEAVVAVACERELTEGILFSHKVPVIGIPNTRPKGPCKETQVDIAEVREAVDAFGV